MKRWILVWAAFAASVVVTAQAGTSLEFMENFALDDAREKALAELVPGTDDYFSYHCLHYQLSGDRKAFQALLDEWVKARKGSWNDAMKELRRRQYLLDFERDPEATWKFLVDDDLHLQFSHRPKSAQVTPDYPAKIDADRYSLDRFLRRAMARRNPVTEFTDAGLELAARQELNDAERRSLLSRLTRSDIPKLVELIIADLKAANSRGFGSHNIHRLLTLEQLEDLGKRDSALLNNAAYLQERLARMQPGEEVDIDNDVQAAVAFYTRLWAFVKDLDPQHNSHKALVLYRLLDAQRRTGVYDAALFKQYLALPRNVSYIERDLLQRWRAQRVAWVDMNNRLPMSVPIPPIEQDEPLVRDFLLQRLHDAESPAEYREFFEERWLDAVFAESKILYGVGDPATWSSKLTPEQYRAIRERVEINFALVNPRQFRPGDIVSLDVDVKNAEQLLVKVFEIQAFNYYKQNRAPVDQSVDLDGMVATHERKFTYESPATQRVRRTLNFPEIADRGVYVIELIGNGVSSRALVYVGKLEYLTVPTAHGQAVAVLNESGELVKDARLWMAGSEYTADDAGLILLPYSNAEQEEFVILRQGNFCSPDRLRHLGEAYTFSAGIFVEPQAVGRLRTSMLVLRPDLRVNGIPIDPALLEDVKVTLRSVDARGTPIEREFTPKFERDREWATDFFTPDALRSLQVTVSARIQQKRNLEKLDLADSWGLNVNGARGGTQLRQVHLVPTADGWYAEVRGVNGEPIPGIPLNVALVHPFFTDDDDLHLTTDAAGRVALGPLTGLASVRLGGPDMIPLASGLQSGWAELPTRITVPAGESVELPHPYPAMPGELSEVSLFQTLRGSVLRDAGKAVTSGQGRLKIGALEPGTYTLTVHASGQTVELLVSDGMDRFGFAVGNLRRLQLSARALPVIGKTDVGRKTLTIQLDNANASTRLTAVARRYLASGPEPDVGQGFPEPVVREVRYPFTQYVSGRNIGDEYRYVLERRFAEKYAGTLLGRPGLILNPWMLRETSAEREHLRSDEAYKDYRQALALATSSAVKLNKKPQRGNYGGKEGDGKGGWGYDKNGDGEMVGALGYDFLPQGARVATNLQPDKNGVVRLPLDDLAEQSYVDLYLTDRYGVARYRVLLPDRKLAPRDQRLAEGLDPTRSFSRQKRVRALKPDATVTFADSATARHHVLQTVGDAYDLLQTLGGQAELNDFAFLKRWPELTKDEKLEKLNEYACHELHLFLYLKDPEFFAAVVKPYLANKKDKTFVDRWMLGDSLTDGFGTYELGRRNALEQWLWAKRTGDDKRVLNHFTEAWELLPPNPDERNAWILAALNLSGLEMMDTDDDGLRDEDGRRTTSIYARKSLAARSPEEPASPGPGIQREARWRANLAGETSADPSSGPVKEEGERRLDLGLSLAVDVPRQAQVGQQMLDRVDGFVVNDLESRARLLGEGLQKRLYRKLPRTKEWAEQNYYKLRVGDDVPERILPSAFWRDAAAGSALSPAMLGAHRNLTEIIAALALSDLRFSAPEAAENRVGPALSLTVAAPALLVSEEILPAERSSDDRPLLLSQQFFRPDDLYRFEGNEQIEKFVDGEFIRRVVYGGRVTLTNPTASRRRLSVLLQIPIGAVPVRNGFYTDDRTLVLEAYTTQKLEYYFYFPEAGEFEQFPAHAAVDEAIVGKADPRLFHVVPAPTEVDRTSWDWISQNGSEADVLAYLAQNNLRRLDLDLMAWRLRDKTFFNATVAVLEQNLLYHETTYRYGFMHRDVARAGAWLQHSDVARRVGPALESPLLTVDPVERAIYEHLEYDPLVNPRAHQVGAERKILNTALREQYTNFLFTQAYYPTLRPADRLALTYYLALQDRLGEAIAQLARIDRKVLVEQLQYDYLAAWIAMRQLEPERARKLAAAHVAHPVKRWRTRFQNLVNTLDEAAGKAADVADKEDRQQDIDRQAAREPSLEMEVKDGKVTVTAHNLAACTLNFYPMDIELLFSRKPFLAQEGGSFAVIRPSLTRVVKVSAAGQPTPIELPTEVRDQNMMIEATAAGLQRSQVYYANRLQVRVIENYGQVEVRSAVDGKPLPTTYIKVCARLNSGQVEFWKDGYTDLRGRFDYVSLNDRDPSEVQALAILVLHEEHGAEIREAGPPKQ